MNTIETFSGESTPPPRLVRHSPEWFADCFTNPVTGVAYSLPENLRRMSERLCRVFNIGGVCDPMYIANVAAFELGCGDGCGEFHPASAEAQSEFGARLAKLAERLCFSYSSNVTIPASNLAGLMSKALQ